MLKPYNLTFFRYQNFWWTGNAESGFSRFAVPIPTRNGMITTLDHCFNIQMPSNQYQASRNTIRIYKHGYHFPLIILLGEHIYTHFCHRLLMLIALYFVCLFHQFYKSIFLNLFCKLIFWTLPVLLILGEWHITTLVTNIGPGSDWKQVITWPKVKPALMTNHIGGFDSYFVSYLWSTFVSNYAEKDGPLVSTIKLECHYDKVE